MDETAYRQARKAAVGHPCPFEKALLAGCGTCALAQRRNIAEREAVACVDGVAREACDVLLRLLRRNATFALHLPHPENRLTHAQEMKVQCGGLEGLQRALTGAQEVGDVNALVQAACRSRGSLEDLPYSVIVQSVAAYRTRRRTRQP
ncbi:MAG: hypothetical protein C3F19_02370 [Rhodocyclales bacterium]|nr:MAG: hypothetical protein C3F19_02370 [Rhodocyclales bacterium]